MATTATPASTPLGSYKASVVYGKALMARTIKRRNLLNDMSGPVPLDQWMTGVTKSETFHGMPIVQVNDLSKTAGDRVTVDIIDRVGGKPIMGDRIAKNSGEKISILRDEVKIDQSRKVIEPGGRMSQQRTPHQLREKGQVLGLDYFSNLLDNQVMVHMAGARGCATGIEWKVPLATDVDFADIMVNPVLPPTYTRYVGLTSSVTNPTQVSTTNLLTLNFFDDLRTINDTSAVPLQGIKLQGMGGEIVEGENSALLVCYISTEQWNQLQKDTSAQNWRTFLAQASERLAFTKHPLFRNGMCGLWRDILICQAPRPIEFRGSSVSGYQSGFDSVSYVDTNDVTQTGTVAANVRLHRGVLLGAQALACAWGNAERWTGAGGGSKSSGTHEMMNIPYSWVEKLEDGDNLLQFFIGSMFGFKKLQYKFDNRIYDNGVFTFDSHVPALRT